MPTPVPVKILSRRDQRTRLLVVLLVALGTGIAAGVVRPHFTGPPHPEAIGSLIVLMAACVVLLLGLRRMAYGRAATVFVIEATALWLCYVLGWIISGQRLLGELLVVIGMSWVITVALGLFALSLIHHRWPPRRLMTCPSCEYGLRGLTARVCPECGERFNATCAACGCALADLAGAACPDCGAAVGTETVLVDRA